MKTQASLAILDEIPNGFLDCPSCDLHMLLNGPTLIELTGKREPPLFVSILLHGNEDSGLGAIQKVIRRYQDRPLPRSLMLLVGNVEAARHSRRRLDSQPDYNRIWPGTRSQADTAEKRIMAEVHARVLDRCAIAAIDLHNNTGRNPHYAVVCNLDPVTLGLAGIFSRRAVCFRGLPGTQTASFANLIPAVTAECGQPGNESNAAAGAHFVNSVLNLDELPIGVEEGTVLDLYHTLGVVRVREHVSFTLGSGDAELRFEPALEKHNFRELKPGTVLGETSHRMPLQMANEAGEDVADDYFENDGGKLKLRKPAVPAMLTGNADIVRQDCLCYLMERL